MAHDRKKYPAPFEVSMIGPEGHYRLTYTACDDTDGKIDVEIAGVAMTWFVEIVSQKDEGVTLSGMTTGSQAIWQDQFWFELWPHAHPPRIDYWGNQVLWRTDLPYGPEKSLRLRRVEQGTRRKPGSKVVR